MPYYVSSKVHISRILDFNCCSQCVGASHGLGAIHQLASSWAPLFSRAPLPELLPFIHQLLQPPSRPDVARIFAPQALDALGRVLMAGGAHRGVALSLLMDLCTTLQPQVQPFGGAINFHNLYLVLYRACLGTRLHRFTLCCNEHFPKVRVVAARLAAGGLSSEMMLTLMTIVEHVAMLQPELDCSFRSHYANERLFEDLSSTFETPAASFLNSEFRNDCLQGRVSDGLPLLLTAQPSGPQLAAFVRQLATSWSDAGQSASLASPGAAASKAVDHPSAGSAGDLNAQPSTTTSAHEGERFAVAWAALQLTPYACENSAQAIALCRQVLQPAHEALQHQAAPNGYQPAAAAAAAKADALLMLRGTAAEMLASLLAFHQPLALPELAREVAEWLSSRADNYSTVHAAAVVFEALKQRADGIPEAVQLLSSESLQRMCPLVLANLSHPSRKMRSAALKVRSALVKS